MPPKEKPKKPTAGGRVPQTVRLPISDASLNYVPEDAIEGYQERIDSGVPWTLTEQAARHHKELCMREEIPPVSFSEALQNRINNSILNGFLDENSGLTFEQHWELNLPITMWDVIMFGNEEARICFDSANAITDDLVKIIRKAVVVGNKEALKKELKEVTVLRVIDSKMTKLDKELISFRNLATLNVCGNYLSEINKQYLPPGLRALELQANAFKTIKKIIEELPMNLVYLGLARNLLTNDSLEGLHRMPHDLTVLDLSDNDIYDLEPVLDALSTLPSLSALLLAGNPCAICAGYARTTLMRLQHLIWLDGREILPTDRSIDPYEPHPDDLRSTYFNFTVIRIMAAPQPPKLEKGAVTTFHVELELPLLDVARRRFLMYRRNESLVEMLPPPEDDPWPPSKLSLAAEPSKSVVVGEGEQSSHASDIYNHLTSKNSREIRHYTTFESNRVQWNKVMNFQEPAVRIFCPDLRALRDTFRTQITVRLIYSVTYPTKSVKGDKKSAGTLKAQASEQRVCLAAIKCALRKPDWTQGQQHFHWDDSLDTDEAVHWGDGNLAVIQYSQAPPKSSKSKSDGDSSWATKPPPENLTCHFGFGIDTVHV